MQILEPVFWPLLPLLLGVNDSIPFQIPLSFFFSSEMWLNSNYKIVLGKLFLEKVCEEVNICICYERSRGRGEWEEQQLLTWHTDHAVCIVVRMEHGFLSGVVLQYSNPIAVLLCATSGELVFCT